MRFSADLPPAGSLCLPAGKYAGILTFFKHKSTKKRPKMHFFCHLLTSEMPAADSQMTTSFFMLQSWMLDSH